MDIIDFSRDQDTEINYNELDNIIKVEFPFKGSVSIPRLTAKCPELEKVMGSGFNLSLLCQYSRRTRPALTTEQYTNIHDYLVTVFGTTCLANKITYTELIQAIKGIKNKNNGA